MSDTRQKILDIATELFAERGYAATSLSDIAERLGTSKAALYYHFRSKGAILDALVSEPLTAFTKLAAAARDLPPRDLLAAILDTAIAMRTLFELLDKDPSTRKHLDADATRATSAQVNATLVAVLAGPDPTAGSTARAHAAYATVKNAALAILAQGGDLDDLTRRELLAAAVRALEPGA
ncbi:TetR/AcrR family transcriptional regulator [Labedaea rhizosphaerae]|uniref:TetR family transcriptional regulator n=1 Tax=Labedaea rhizosphaerae TaxID=598644 RepID=A0A4R6SIN1_LABRH|nr:TetR/AcrR family transcriptional regulator [Labedaea rhizosphaerae]TDQ01533.1 TetR family transcriptional regulator [Labedaea rhizosphaerae]